MAKEDYEVVPHQLLSDLRFEVEALKKKLTQPDAKVNELILEIESMKDAIHELNTMFSRVLEEMKGDDPSKLLKDVTTKMENVMSQNETIAKGMIAISDKVEEWMEKQDQRGPMPLPMGSMPQYNQQPSMPQRGMGIGMPPPIGGMGSAPRAMSGPDFNNESDFPPPPPSMTGGDKKKLIGGIFK